MAEAKFYEGYSRFNEHLNRYETWNEAVSRVMSMHKDYYSDMMTDELLELINFAEKMYKDKKVLGAQRALQFGGDQLLKHHFRMYNCTGAYADRPEFFGEGFYLMLCGAGVGVSVQYKHINKLPDIIGRTKEGKTFEVPDSIEGWAQALDVLMSSFFEGGGVHQEYEGNRVYFDLTKIRPKGAYISGGFKAPGPEPLRKALDHIENLLVKRIRKGESRLRPIDVYDIIVYFADAVIAGGVRRAAVSILFSADDKDMMRAKTGDWYNDNPQRARSNNSVVLLRDKVTYRELESIVKYIKEFGEPGFVFSDSEDVVYNPCFEVSLYPQTEDGVSGWQACVSGDTKLITENSICKISEVIGTPINIWNGKSWSTVTPVKTGTNRELFRVTLSDGSFLDCTSNHTWLVKNRFEKVYREVQTDKLLLGESYVISTPRSEITYTGGISLEKAYEYGFILGDASVKGTSITADIHTNTGKELISFADTKVLKVRNRKDTGTEFKTLKFENLNVEFARSIKYDFGLPKDMFSWDRQSILNFIAGWADADGTNASKGIRIYGREDKIRDGQLLLAKIGINSSVNLMARAGDFVKSIGVFRKNDVWYLQITKTIDIPCNRLICNNLEDAKYKGKTQIIKSVVKLEGLHDTYCFEELELHQGTFNNVLTKQCNLSEINGAKSSTKREFFDQCQAAAILGTLQAGYTDFRFLGEESHKIIETEALIGVGITGWMNSPKILFDESIMQEGANIVLATNKLVAALLGINSAARSTVVKPSGNASVVLSTTSGIHGEHAPRYIRNVQISKESEIARVLLATNPDMIEESVWSNNGTDYCVSFPVISPEGSIYRDDLLGIKQLEYVKKAQQNWIEYGTDIALCAKPYLRHNVSNTITVDDWDEVIDYVFDNKEYFCGISFMAENGDKNFFQSPFSEVLTMDQIVSKYGNVSLLTSALIEAGITAFNDNFWEACKVALEDNIGDRSSPLRKDFLRRFNKFATNFNTKQECVECLKDIYLFHKWWKIQKTCSIIDFNDFLKESKYTDIDTMSAQGCAGGACELVW